MNPNYEVLEQILRLDIEAGNATASQRIAQRQLEELARKSKASEELISKTRTEMAFNEGELRRQYKKIDELDLRKLERSTKLFSAKTDEEHRSIKHDVDNIEREVREINRRIDELESKIEAYKNILFKAHVDLSDSLHATADERTKAEQAEKLSLGKLNELSKVRNNYLVNLDERVEQHYSRVAKVTKNPCGPIAKVVEGACSNCHIGVSPQLFNLILRGKEVEFCPNCHHILIPVLNS